MRGSGSAHDERGGLAVFSFAFSPRFATMESGRTSGGGRMAGATKELRFSNPEELATWLNYQPTEWSRVIAFRATMRAVPILGSLFVNNNKEIWFQNLFVAVFRSLLMSAASLDKAISTDGKIILTQPSMTAARNLAKIAQAVSHLKDPRLC